MFFVGIRPHLNAMFLFPFVLLLQLLFTLAVCLFVSAVNLFVRDLERVVSVLMMMLFYLTPVVYASDMVPDELKEYIVLNPMAIIVTSWRDILINGNLNWAGFSLVAMLSCGLLFLSYRLFAKLSPRFAEVL
jgi:lipopolysaccharide transport system permease protein